MRCRLTDVITPTSFDEGPWICPVNYFAFGFDIPIGPDCSIRNVEPKLPRNVNLYTKVPPNFSNGIYLPLYSTRLANGFHNRC